MRPKAYTILLLFCLLSGLVFPFTASNYFYGSEDEVTVTSEDFTLAGDDYSIIYFDGEPTFLLKNGQVVENQSGISQPIYDHYITNYYPSEEEISELRGLVLAYNVSRNDGYDFKEKEEYICRGILFTDKRIDMYIDGKMQKLWCHDNASCDLNAKLLFQAYHEYTGWNSFEPALIPLEAFSYASYGTDFILENMTYKLDNMDEDSVVETLTYIEDSVPTLRDYLEDIEGTIFRLPRMDDEEDKDDCYLRCYALCPSLDLNETILTQLADKADELSDNIGPLAEHGDTTSLIHDNTAARLSYYESTTTADEYNLQFSPIEKKGLEVEQQAEEVNSLVVNTSFAIKLDRLSELRTQIRSKIDGLDFEGLDSDITQYTALVETVENASDTIYAVYNESFIAKNDAEKVLFEVGTRDLGPVEKERLDELKTEIAELDEEFGAGLTPAQYESLEENYTRIGNEATALLGSTEAGGVSKAMVYFRGFARKLNGGLAEFAETTNITEVEKIPENQYFTFGGFSFFVFLSFSAMLLLLFLYLVKAHGYSRIKYVIITGFALGLISVALFAGFLYVFMQKTSTDATMDEFLVDFTDRETVALVVDARTSSEAEKTAMSSCADSIAISIEDSNKTVYMYYLESGDACRKIVGTSEYDMDEEDCLSEIGEMDSAIYLNPSETIDEPALYTTYFSKAEIYATSDYYSICPLSAVFE